MDISALARNFWTAFFLCSLSRGSFDAGTVSCVAAALCGKKAIGGDGDVAEDDGVAIYACSGTRRRC